MTVVVALRPATRADGPVLWRWRNDPATRAASRQKHEVTLDQHFGWLEASLQRDDRLLLVASDDVGDVTGIGTNTLQSKILCFRDTLGQP